MNEMLANLQASIARIGSEGEGAGQRMAEATGEALCRERSAPTGYGGNLQAFVESMQQSMGQGQQETMAKIAGSVEALGEQLGGLFKQLEHTACRWIRPASGPGRAAPRHSRNGWWAGEAGRRAADCCGRQNGTMQGTIKLLSAQTEQHLQSMQQGADKMRQRPERFDTAGQSVSKAGEATAGALGAIQGSSAELVGASRELNSVVADYRNNREAVNQTLAVLQGVVASTQGQAAGRSQYLQDLKQQGERLQALNREVNDYLEQISGVLGKGFNDSLRGWSAACGKH